MTYERLRNVLLALLVAIAALYLINLAYHAALSFSGIIFLYFTAWLFSFLLSPIVDWLCAHRFPRLLAVGYVYLVLVALIIIMVLALVPTVINQGARLTDPRQFDLYRNALINRATDLQTFLVEHTHLPKANIVSFVDEVNRQFLAQFQQINDNLVKLSGQITGTAVTISLTIVQSSLNWLLNAVIIMVLSFYMTLDGKRLIGSLMRFLPETWASELAAFNASVSRSFGGYIRGQLLLGLIYALMTYITLIVFHISFAVALAVFAGVMMLIPFIGTYLAIIPPLVVAGLQATNAGSVIWLAIVLIFWQQITINVLASRILGDSVGMHPLLVFLGLLLGTKLAGPWGAIFGVPALGVCLTLVQMIYRRLVIVRQLGTDTAEARDYGEHVLPELSSTPSMNGVHAPGPVPDGTGAPYEALTPVAASRNSRRPRPMSSPYPLLRGLWQQRVELLRRLEQRGARPRHRRP